MPVKVLIADDHPLMITGIRRVLERCEEIEVAGEARSGPEVMRLVELRRPDLVLMDLRMPGVCGTEHIEQVRSRWPEVKVVVLSACGDRSSVDSALAAGASAYVVKSVDPPDIASIVRQAVAGSVFHAVPRRGGEDNLQAEGPRLTERERAILDGIAAGLTSEAISRDLWISEHTVKFHLSNIYRKLGVPNRAGAVRYALEHQMIAAA
jgi:DNA-binding NarL/FixJ family response regulator